MKRKLFILNFFLVSALRQLSKLLSRLKLMCDFRPLAAGTGDKLHLFMKASAANPFVLPETMAPHRLCRLSSILNNV